MRWELWHPILNDWKFTPLSLISMEFSSGPDIRMDLTARSPSEFGSVHGLLAFKRSQLVGRVFKNCRGFEGHWPSALDWHKPDPDLSGTSFAHLQAELNKALLPRTN